MSFERSACKHAAALQQSDAGIDPFTPIDTNTPINSPAAGGNSPPLPSSSPTSRPSMTPNLQAAKGRQVGGKAPREAAARHRSDETSDAVAGHEKHRLGLPGAPQSVLQPPVDLPGLLLL